MKKTFNHLDFNQRQLISEGLMKNKTFTQIANEIGVSRTTVSREIKRNRIKTGSYFKDGKPMECIHFDTCTHIRCKGPHKCSEYVAHTCARREKYLVCHACRKQASCRYIKYHYSARKADVAYDKKLSDSRSGIRATSQEIAMMDDIVNNRITKNKQSPYHIYASNEHLMPVCLSTFYRYVNYGILEIKHIHLPKAVRYKTRKKEKDYTPTDIAYKNGRTYADYKNHLALILPNDVVQMDTVLGKINEPQAILTLLFEKSDLLIGLKLEKRNLLYVRQTLKRLCQYLGFEQYAKLFNILITDNGKEFQNPSFIDMYDNLGERISTVFYCDPYASWQKAKIENCHRLVRRVIPKGFSLKPFCQDHISLMCNHINSLKREYLNGLSAYEAFVKQYGSDIADLLGLYPIPENEVCLNPILLK